MNRDERDELILSLRRRGLTLEEIGKRVGLTAARIRQVLAELGGPGPDEVRRARKELLESERAIRAAQIREAAELNPTVDVEVLADRLGVPRAEVLAALPKGEALRRKAPVPAIASTAMYTRPIREVAKMHDLPGLTVRQYDRLRLARHPSSARIRQVVGSWTVACQQAGVAAAGQGRSRGSRWGNGEVEHWVDAYLASESPTYSYRDFDRWLRSQEGAPSAQTVRNLTGMNWTQILAAGNRRAARESA